MFILFCLLFLPLEGLLRQADTPQREELTQVILTLNLITRCLASHTFIAKIQFPDMLTRYTCVREEENDTTIKTIQ